MTKTIVEMVLKKNNFGTENVIKIINLIFTTLDNNLYVINKNRRDEVTFDDFLFLVDNVHSNYLVVLLSKGDNYLFLENLHIAYKSPRDQIIEE